MLLSPTSHQRISLVILLSFLLFSAGLPISGAIANAASKATEPSVNPAPDVQPGSDSLTIYNQDFAVVRQSLRLHLLPGVNPVHFADTTARVETDSVILRDPTGQHHLQVLEQSYRADPISEQFLLSLNEGKVLEFEAYPGTGKGIIQGKVIRSGYARPNSQTGQLQPIIEYDGRLHFGLPGTPIFPSLGDDTILKPTLDWRLRTDKPGDFNAELSYLTGGLSWHADYNLVVEGKGDSLELIGWVTFNNQSGRAFRDARVNLMAGDVNKIEPNSRREYAMAKAAYLNAAPADAAVVTEKAFDEFHLYSLQNPVTLRDNETKQVEFVRAAAVKAQRLYVYDGARLDQYNGWNIDSIRQNSEYGTLSNPKVYIIQQFKNSAANNLGMPLPKGRLRFYRRDTTGNLEFTGENVISHTPKDETVRVYTGNAFDLDGEHKRVDYHVERRSMDESFEINPRNHKEEAAEIRVVEHLYRSANWQIVDSTEKFDKIESQT